MASSNASMDRSGTISDLIRKKEKIETKVKGLLEEELEADKQTMMMKNIGAIRDIKSEQTI